MIYIKRHTFGAGKWIYKGYKLAWEALGYETSYYSNLDEIEIEGSDCEIMALDADINTGNLEKLKKAKRVYLYVQPNRFPLPWGSHPNFVSMASDDIIEKINELENVYLWSFGDPGDNHFKWKKVHTIPLAYDSISYQVPPTRDVMYDICYIGGWANNGFDEKRKILIKHFIRFKESGLKCGFFINRDLTHDQENNIISNSRLALNIHDAYQRELGLDTNERTFKALGLNGMLVSDNINQIARLFPDLEMSSDPDGLVDIAKKLLNLPADDLELRRASNIQVILENHCYAHRVKKLLSL
tara:strand:+ start:6957 stop:7853 length:897 start_codon:yes stop_codon:yes gene_type:complete